MKTLWFLAGFGRAGFHGWDVFRLLGESWPALRFIVLSHSNIILIRRAIFTWSALYREPEVTAGILKIWRAMVFLPMSRLINMKATSPGD
jgi:hypothetical protein